MKIDLAGQTALVTGASRGIGQAISKTLGEAGARIIGTATRTEGAERISETLAAAGMAGYGLALDVAAPGSVEALHQRLKAEDNPPTILINNAGITRDNLLLRMADDDWQQVIDTNLSGIYRLSKLCLRPMMKRRYGRIINISSVVALSGNAGQANYAAAKAGMMGLSRSLAQEVGSRGITVNCIAPGFIATDMTDALSAAQQQQLLAKIPLRRLGRPDEVAAAAAFLASDAAGYISGAVIQVNGGLYMS